MRTFTVLGHWLHSIQNTCGRALHLSGSEQKRGSSELSTLSRQEALVISLTMHILAIHILFSALVSPWNQEVRDSVHQPKMKKIMDHPSILPHLLSLGPLPSKRPLQNLIELFQAEYGALTSAPDPLWLGAVCLGHGLRIRKGFCNCEQSFKDCGTIHTKQLEINLHDPFYCITSTAKKNKGDKSRQLRNAHGKQHRVWGSLAWNTTLIFTLGPFLNSIW